jgi:hypothetical protein
MHITITVKEFAKRVAFRSPFLNWLSRPGYSCGLDPETAGNLAQLRGSLRLRRS